MFSTLTVKYIGRGDRQTIIFEALEGPCAGQRFEMPQSASNPPATFGWFAYAQDAHRRTPWGFESVGIIVHTDYARTAGLIPPATADTEPALCVHDSDDCPLCEDQAAIADRQEVAEVLGFDTAEQMDEHQEWLAKHGSREHQEWIAGVRASRFDPRDCGGVFDGFGMVSDADPGL
jgi:hypothetical protein